eukprot:SAG22_NODE_317_length_12513_cov_41.467214_5_plen_63_part_00
MRQRRAEAAERATVTAHEVELAEEIQREAIQTAVLAERKAEADRAAAEVSEECCAQRCLPAA